MSLTITALVLLMAAPSATDEDVANHAVPLGMYTTLSECNRALGWIAEHQQQLDTHLWCSNDH